MSSNSLLLKIINDYIKSGDKKNTELSKDTIIRLREKSYKIAKRTIKLKIET